MPTFDDLEVLGELITSLSQNTSARTDQGKHGELHMYVSGGKIYWQQYNIDTGDWRAIVQEESVLDHGSIAGLTDDDHTQYHTDARAVTWHDSDDHSSLSVAHADTTGKTANDHHAEAHTVPSHTGTPGGELGGTWTSPTVDTTHSGSAHHAQSHTAASHSDQGATGAELEELTDGSETTLHSHAGGGATTVSKTADETVNSSTTLQNDNHLTFSVSANTIYKVTGGIVFDSGGVPDIKFDWSLPASGTYGGLAFYASGNNIVNWSSVQAVPGGAAPLGFTFQILVTIAGTSGSATLQWAQNTSDAGNTTVKDGSWITYEEVS